MIPLPQRCALYTRKSSDEGLEQAFNSLDAQREACVAYVKSQTGEGWRALPTIYDDGGFSGGSMERPALKSLMADIAAGKVDVVVVYKIDRLTRSLPDFARIVELFDCHNVSFVSVTQAFNTTTSMGRLTLNVLLSFAQFEREVTGERIRDKIAASKKKGMWMGGLLPLGYDRPLDSNRVLVVNETEAATVRHIFRTYVELGSVHALERTLALQNVRSKARVTLDDRSLGKMHLSRGALFHLLRNPIYIGKIVHKAEQYEGAHEAIVDTALFEAAAASLDTNARRHATTRIQSSKALLAGRIFDADGQPMSPTFGHGARGQVYRYYVTASLQQGQQRPTDDWAIRRVSAPVLEGKLRELMMSIISTRVADELEQLIRVEVHSQSLQLLLPIALHASVAPRLGTVATAVADAARPELLRITFPVRIAQRGGRTTISGTEPSLARRDSVLIKALRAAHALTTRTKTGAIVNTAATLTNYQRTLIELAFLAPDIQSAIIDGRQPADMTLAAILRSEMSSSWTAQRAQYGITQA